MKYLIIEGDGNLRNLLKRTLNNKDPSISIIDTPYAYDALYYLIYTDEEFDKIIIGDDLETSIEDVSSDEWVRTELQKVRDCKYFPVELGKACIEFCKKAGKKQPKVIIWTIGFGYKFNAPPNTPYDKVINEVGQYVKDNGMQLVSKESYDMIKKMLTALE